jgi:drug/metabolite transporter (DMT)-like permease
VLSCGVAYTLQIIAQSRTDPTVASLILCMESFFAAVFGWIILGQSLALREIIGCVLMLAAILLAQVADKIRLPFRNVKQE